MPGCCNRAALLRNREAAAATGPQGRGPQGTRVNHQVSSTQYYVGGGANSPTDPGSIYNADNLMAPLLLLTTTQELNSTKTGK